MGKCKILSAEFSLSHATCTRITTIFVSHESFPLDTSGIHNNSALNGNGCRTIKLRVVNFSENFNFISEKGVLCESSTFSLRRTPDTHAIDGFTKGLGMNVLNVTGLHPGYTRYDRFHARTISLLPKRTKKPATMEKFMRFCRVWNSVFKLGLFVKSVNHCSVVEFDEFVVCLCCRTWQCPQKPPSTHRPELCPLRKVGVRWKTF